MKANDRTEVAMSLFNSSNHLLGGVGIIIGSDGGEKHYSFRNEKKATGKVGTAGDVY